jgi:two-component system LytT family response regulator
MNRIQTLRALIIDDEMSAILLLEEMLKKLDGITVLGFAQNIEDGLNFILKSRPDIIFLDIKLNEENGFELINKLKSYDIDPFIVMVTGYDQFGMEALKAGAFDYLLKPVDPNELLKVISRFRQKQPTAVHAEPVRKIRFNTIGGFILVHPDEILFCQAEANYTDIILTNQNKHTISMNIGSIEKVLIKPLFFRISRSAIINVRYLAEINRSKRACLLMAGDHSIQLTISYERIKELEGRLVQ